MTMPDRQDDRPDRRCLWLLKDGKVLASAETADNLWRRFVGLLGRDHLDGVLVLPGTKSVHSFGMRFPLDVAFLDDENTVIRTVALPPNRVTGPCLAAASVIEAPAGSFATWCLEPGDHLDLTEATAS